MDPTNPESFNHRTELLSTGRTYHFVDQLPEGYDPKRHPTILCVHGFPDIWYGWRYQIGPWVRRGSRVVVPDMLGYGGTSKPAAPEEYTTKKLSDDLAALLDLIGVQRAVVIGHDWGSYTVGRFALWHPDRVLALVMMSVPYIPPSPVYLPLTEVVKRAPNFGYQVYFSEQRSSQEILDNLDRFVAAVFIAPSGANESLDFTPLGALERLLREAPRELLNAPSILTDKERQYYIQELGKGMNGPLNYYRTSRLRHDEELAVKLPAALREDLPVFFMWGTDDATVTPSVTEKSWKFIRRYRDIAIEGKGHWLMVEAREEITNHVIQWLETLFGPSLPGSRL